MNRREGLSYSPTSGRRNRLVGAGVLGCTIALISLAGAGSSLLIAAPQDARLDAQDRKSVISSAANESLGLLASEIVALDVPVNPQGFTTTLPITSIDGATTDHTIDLWLHSSRAAAFEVKAQQADGSWITHDPGQVRTLRGEVRNMPGSIIAGTLREDGLEASVWLNDGRQFWIEPALRATDIARADEYVIYNDLDKLSGGGTCGVSLAMEAQARRELAEAAAQDVDNSALLGTGNLSCTELACDADVEYFNDYGSVANVQARIESIMNTVNVQYETQTDITHLITTILVRTAEPDPYTSTDAGTLLNQFRSEWLNNQGGVTRDVAQLFTGKFLQGSTIGVAFTIGGICTTSAYCLVESDCCGSFGCATDLTAHELGHLWGGFHCGCPGFTMNPSITCANEFTAGTINSIVSHRNSRNCLEQCDGAETGTTTLPLCDEFPSTTIDGSLWTGIDGVTSDGVGINEPSAPNSLRLNGTDEIRSARMDTTGAAFVTVSYSWQRTGGANSPENGEDLVVEYRSDVFTWEVIANHPGSGPDMTTYQAESFDLPSDAFHQDFRIRFRKAAGNDGFDDYFVDDVKVDSVITPTGDTCIFAPPVNDGANPISNAGAQTDGFSEPCGDFESDIWVRYVTTCDGTLTASICDADFDTELAVYGVQCPFGPNAALDCNADSCGTGSEVSIPVSSGQLYRFRIGSEDGSWGSGTLVISCDAGGDPTGACCFGDGSCTEETAADCSSAGGTYQGDGTACAPNPCPQPMGACCFADGSCSDETAADCGTAGGTYQGDGTDCGTAACPQPCPWDCEPPGGNGVVNFDDLVAVVNGISTQDLQCDVAPDNGDGTFGNGVITFDDILAVINNFGSCP